MHPHITNHAVFSGLEGSPFGAIAKYSLNVPMKSKPPVELVVCLYPKRVNYQPTR